MAQHWLLLLLLSCAQPPAQETAVQQLQCKAWLVNYTWKQFFNFSWRGTENSVRRLVVSVRFLPPPHPSHAVCGEDAKLFFGPSLTCPRSVRQQQELEIPAHTPRFWNTVGEATASPESCVTFQADVRSKLRVSLWSEKFRCSPCVSV